MKDPGERMDWGNTLWCQHSSVWGAKGYMEPGEGRGFRPVFQDHTCKERPPRISRIGPFWFLCFVVVLGMGPSSSSMGNNILSLTHVLSLCFPIILSVFYYLSGSKHCVYMHCPPHKDATEGSELNSWLLFYFFDVTI
jgi:hypothetical protein